MKKTKTLSLILITSALASGSYMKTFSNAPYPENLSGIPKHWSNWDIPEAGLMAPITYHKDSTNHSSGHTAGNNSAIERGGFGGHHYSAAS